MSLSSDDEKRIQRIETALAEHTTAINNLASKKQLNHALTLITNQVKELQAKIDSLESQLNSLKK